MTSARVGIVSRTVRRAASVSLLSRNHGPTVTGSDAAVTPCSGRLVVIFTPDPCSTRGHWRSTQYYERSAYDAVYVVQMPADHALRDGNIHLSCTPGKFDSVVSTHAFVRICLASNKRPQRLWSQLNIRHRYVCRLRGHCQSHAKFEADHKECSSLFISLSLWQIGRWADSRQKCQWAENIRPLSSAELLEKITTRAWSSPKPWRTVEQMAHKALALRFQRSLGTEDSNSSEDSNSTAKQCNDT